MSKLSSPSEYVDTSFPNKAVRIVEAICPVDRPDLLAYSLSKRSLISALFSSTLSFNF